MSWETDYSTTLPAFDGDTIRKAARTAAELCPIEQLPEALQMLGIVATPGRKGPTKAMRPPPDVDYMRRLREAGYTTPEIGRKVGLHPSTVSEHLNGRRRK